MLFGGLYELRIETFTHRSLDTNKKAISPCRRKQSNQVPIGRPWRILGVASTPAPGRQAAMAELGHGVHDLGHCVQERGRWSRGLLHFCAARSHGGGASRRCLWRWAARKVTYAAVGGEEGDVCGGGRRWPLRWWAVEVACWLRLGWLSKTPMRDVQVRGRGVSSRASPALPSCEARIELLSWAGWGAFFSELATALSAEPGYQTLKSVKTNLS
jgi:hypothetical protein